jgi:AcrR family transcriptional regulator
MPSTNAIALKAPAAPSRKVVSRQNRTRDRIITESAKLFLARGFTNVSVDQIVDAAEIARSSFYRFFPNREEVLASIIRPVFETGVVMMQDVARLPAGQIVDGILGMYLSLWGSGHESLQLATRMGGAYFRLFEDVHRGFRTELTGLLKKVEPTGLLLNGSGDQSARLIARTAVPVLEVYGDDPRLESLFRQTMSGLLIKTEAKT